MFVRIKKSGDYQYLQIVRNFRTFKKIKQVVIGNMGRLDQYKKNGNLKHVILSLTKLQMKIDSPETFKRSPKKRRHRKPSGRLTR